MVINEKSKLALGLKKLKALTWGDNLFFTWWSKLMIDSILIFLGKFKNWNWFGLASSLPFFSSAL